MTIDVLVNPAGASGKAWELWKELEPRFAGKDYALHKSTPEVGIEELARRLTSRGQETYLLVLGGDGTMNEAVNGIADLARTAVGFISCGTGNDLERDMGLPRDKGEQLERILEGKIRREADIGLLSCIIDGEIRRRRFNISSDIGFGAATCAFAERSKLKPILNRLGLGRLIYLIMALKVCFKVAPADVRVKCGGRVRLYRKCLSAIVMSHRHEGGGFEFCPKADFTDGMLDLCVGSGLSKPAYMRVLPMAYMGRHMGMRGITGGRARVIEMRSDRPMWVHTDGEVLGETRAVRMEIIPEKLRLLC